MILNNKIKKIVTILLLASLSLSVTGCKDKVDVGKSGEEATTDSPAVFTPNEENEDVKARANELKDSKALPDVEINKKLKWLSWYPADETSPTAELFKARYGIPEGGDKVISVINTSYETRYDSLATLISSGDSPDFFQFEERNFPYGVWRRQFEPIDDVIDFSGEEWDEMREYIDLFKWGGKNYCAVTELANSSALLFYRKSVAQGAGLDDPYDLWQRNQWTWDTFKQMVSDFSKPDKKWGIVGFYVDEAAILSTGTGLISIEDGKLKSNMEDARIERTMDFLQELALSGYRYPYHELSNFQISPNLFRSGDVLFWCDGPWRYQEHLQVLRDGDNWDEDEVCVVPFPRDPMASEYFQRGKQDSLMLVAGSENKDGFKAWTQCAAVASSDPEMKKLGREKAKIDYKWTDTLLDSLEEIRELTPVWDFKNGIGEDVSGCTFDSAVEILSKYVITFGESYTKLRGEQGSVIESRIDEINSTVE